MAMETPNPKLSEQLTSKSMEKDKTCLKIVQVTKIASAKKRWVSCCLEETKEVENFIQRKSQLCLHISSKAMQHSILKFI